MMKTKTGIIVPPKEAGPGQKTTGWVIDLAFIGLLTYVTTRYFPVKTLLPQYKPLHVNLIVAAVWFLFFVIFANNILSQTLGTFILGLKALTKNGHKRLKFGQALRHSLFLPGSNTEVINSNHKKHKNNILDIAFFGIYHSIVMGGVVFLLMSGSLKAFKIPGLSGQEEATATEVISIKPFLKKISGKVIVTEKGMAARLAKEGEELHAGAVVETQEKSSALIVYGNDYLCQIRLAAKSRINVDELASMQNETSTEDSMFNLVKGSLTVAVTKKNKPMNLRVKTRYAVFAVRGTQFSVISDENYPALVAVKEGEVEAKNLLFPKNNLVKKDMLLLINKDGRDKEITDAAAVNKFDWELEKSEWKEPEISEVMTSIGNPVFESDSVDNGAATTMPGEQDELLKNVALELEAFKVETKFIEEKLAASEVEMKIVADKLMTDRPHIESDIACVSTSRVECKLYMEKILVQRGFPRTFGTPRLMESIAADLVKYMKEQQDKMDQMKIDQDDLRAVLQKREIVLAEAQTNADAKTNLESTLVKLKDKELLRR